MPELTNTFFTPGTSLILLRRSASLRWLVRRVGQAGEQDMSGQAPAVPQRSHSVPYMFAVGPPTSLTIPLNSGITAIRVTSRTMDPMLRLWMIRPW